MQQQSTGRLKEPNEPWHPRASDSEPASGQRCGGLFHCGCNPGLPLWQEERQEIDGVSFCLQCIGETSPERPSFSTTFFLAYGLERIAWAQNDRCKLYRASPRMLVTFPTLGGHRGKEPAGNRQSQAQCRARGDQGDAVRSVVLHALAYPEAAHQLCNDCPMTPTTPQPCTTTQFNWQSMWFQQQLPDVINDFIN